MTEATQIKCDTVIHSIIAEKPQLRTIRITETEQHQLPAKERKIGIIGAGRLGTSLAATTFPQGRVAAISSRRPDHREWLSKRYPDLVIVGDAADVAKLADTVFITTSDTAIGSVCDIIDWQPRHHVIHCSGVLTLDILASAKRAGASVAGFHPLQTFPNYCDHPKLRQISFAVDCQDAELKKWLWNTASALESTPFSIEGELAHNAYHASAVLACGLLAGLVGISAELWENAGIERRRALQLMAPMLRSTIEAIAEDGLPDAISGPYVRGDVETIQKHLETTAKVSADTSRAYAALALAQLHIANEKGNLDSDTLNNIEDHLRQHLKSL